VTRDGRGGWLLCKTLEGQTLGRRAAGPWRLRSQRGEASQLGVSQLVSVGVSYR
jgi:hypothetical protein